MRIFITGATGYIGRVITEQAQAEGHAVHGLSRSEAGDQQLRQLGAVPVRGDLSSLAVLREQSERADAVLHLAYIHDFTMDYEQVLRADREAVDALGAGLRGRSRPLVITSGTALVDPDPAGGETTEDAPPSQTFVLKDRIRSEQHALSLKEQGVNVSAIRLPPYVYGRGGSYFVPLLMQMAATAGESIYVEEGSLRTSTVHVDDASELYLLAAKHAQAGDVFNGTNSTHVSLKQMTEAIATALKVPSRSVSRAEAEARWGQFVTAFVQFENRVSNRKAVEQLGWQPRRVDMLTDIHSGSYLELAEALRQSGKPR